MSKREALIEAAKSLLWERGYEATSPRDIQRVSGAGQGSFYHHFASKKDLCVAALWEVSEAMQADIATAFDPALPPLDRLRAFLGKPRGGLRGCPMGRMVFDSAVVADPELRAPVAAFFEALTAHLERTIAEAQAAGTLPPTVPALSLARTFAAVAQGGAVIGRATGAESAVADALEGLKTLLEAASLDRHGVTPSQ